LGKTERLVGIETEKKNNQELMQTVVRVQMIAQVVFREYVMQSRVMRTRNAQNLVRLSKRMGV
jgi:hypothetical protein